MDYRQVAMRFVSDKEDIDGEINVTNVEEIDNNKIVTVSNEKYCFKLLLVQPVREDETGIWKVKKYKDLS